MTSTSPFSMKNPNPNPPVSDWPCRDYWLVTQHPAQIRSHLAVTARLTTPSHLHQSHLSASALTGMCLLLSFSLWLFHTFRSKIFSLSLFLSVSGSCPSSFSGFVIQFVNDRGCFCCGLGYVNCIPEKNTMSPDGWGLVWGVWPRVMKREEGSAVGLAESKRERSREAELEER